VGVSDVGDDKTRNPATVEIVSGGRCHEVDRPIAPSGRWWLLVTLPEAF
jgi:hypothetical protein